MAARGLEPKTTYFITYNYFVIMLDNDSIVNTSVSKAVEKIPTDEKDYCKCSFKCFTLHRHSTIRADHRIANSRNSCLPTRIYPV